MLREALPPYISKDTAESILFIGKAIRVLKQSASSHRRSGDLGSLTMHSTPVARALQPLGCSAGVFRALAVCAVAFFSACRSRGGTGGFARKLSS